MLNRAQFYLHQALEAQKAKTGMVRVIVLKGRQQGITTYTQARFYWLTSLRRGMQAYILTHEIKATNNVFDMAERFHRLAPIAPILEASNEKEMIFAGQESGYRVATAGSKGTGRSGTAQLFHGSEVAYWPNAEDHLAGIGQVVPRAPGTEMILESTANGVGNVFHRLWTSAERGESDYIPVFIPWYWDEGYTMDPPPGFALTEEERAYKEAYNLHDGQMAWRRAKIASDFAGDDARFRAEYPANAAEAFTAVGHDAWIPPSLVMAAVTRKLEPITYAIPLVIGVDPARFGSNRTSIARRRGRKVFPIERLPHQDTMATAGRIVTIIRDERPARVFIDVGGLGAGVFDRLIELGYGDVVTQVNFGGTANQADRYFNRRSEMWGETKQWLSTGQIPDDPVLIGDLSGPKYSYDSDGRLKLEKKEDMAKRGIQSPDSGDALGLTFAMPIQHVVELQPGARAVEEMFEAMGEMLHRDHLEGLHTG